MKKSLFLFMVILLLLLSGVIYAGVRTNERKDQVTISLQTIYGDASLVEGAEVNLEVESKDHLLWRTQYVAGNEAKTTTEFAFSWAELTSESIREYDGVNLQNGVTSGLGRREEAAGLELAYWELYDETQPGEERKKLVCLKDYIQYFPVDIWIDVPGKYVHYTYSEWDDKQSKILEYFKIPVSDDDCMEISIDKRNTAPNAAIGIGMGTVENWFGMRSYGIVTKDACYFTFDTHRDNGECVDISELKDGYGIYCLPFEMVEDQPTTIKEDEFAMVYPLEADVAIEQMKYDEQNHHIWLFTVEKDVCMVTVIDIETMQMIQKIEISDTHAVGDINIIYQFEDFVAIQVASTGNTIVVLSLAEDGTLNKEWQAPLEYKWESDFWLKGNESMDWDGEKLIIANASISGDWPYDTPNFYLMVCDASGIQYYGEYVSSLNSGYSNQDYYYYCRIRNQRGIAVNWGR